MESNHGPGCACAGFELTDKDDDLFEVIDVDAIRCLNENTHFSCKTIFRPFTERNQPSPHVLKPPEGDPELLLVVPFKEEVKVRAITLYSGNVGKPEKLSLWSNKENFDFSLVEDETPVNELKLNGWTPCNGIEVLTQILKFPRVHKLIIHITGKSDFDIRFMAIKGIRTHAKRGIVHATYEAVAQPDDHSNELKMLQQNKNLKHIE